MSGNTPRKKRSSALLEESSAKLVKTAPKKQAKTSNRSRPATMRTGRAEKPSHYKPGTIVRCKLKNDNGLVLEKTAFRLTVREITHDLQSECKWQGSALEDLQKVAEDDVVRTLAGAQATAHHDKRMNINKKDMGFVKLMRTMFAAQADLFSKY